MAKGLAMKGFDTKQVEAVEFKCNGRQVILRHVKAPTMDAEGNFQFVGYRWQWFKNDFAKKLVKLSTKNFKNIVWEY